jgi:ABC-type oligopeptide transport system substrate-binding subunit
MVFKNTSLLISVFLLCSVCLILQGCAIRIKEKGLFRLDGKNAVNDLNPTTPITET